MPLRRSPLPKKRSANEGSVGGKNMPEIVASIVSARQLEARVRL
jgi:hypothetical protein